MKTLGNGIEIHYELSGPSDAPVVCLGHSLASAMVMWDPQIAMLERNFRVLRHDLRGHGATQASEGPYSLELLAGDVVALWDALDIERAHYVGLSIGGMIGQALALEHGHRLASLCLCDTTARTQEPARAALAARIAAVGEHGLASQADETIERWFSPEFRAQNPSQVALIRQQILDTSPQGYIGCCHALRGLDFLERLPLIKLPTLILVGEDDPASPVAASQAIQARIAGSELKIIPQARHLSNLEQAERFNQHLGDFLRGH